MRKKQIGWCHCEKHNIDFPCAEGCPKCLHYKRVKAVLITRPFLEQILFGKEVHFKVNNPLPKDAKLTQMMVAFWRDSIAVLVESEEFDPVYEGSEIQPYCVTIEDLKKVKK